MSNDLINVVQLRKGLRALFENSSLEVLGELFQNSYRGGAKHVSIETTATGFCYTDDGTGLAGFDGFYSLIRMGESDYEDQSVQANQNPFGIGFHALLAWNKVHEVTIKSNGVSMTIDTTRWWDDPRYYNNWRDMILRDSTAKSGLELVVAGPHVEMRYVEQSAAGYGDLLHIQLNHEKIFSNPPCIQNPFWSGTYMGCQLQIGSPYMRSYQPESVVNWYGQIIYLPSLACMGFELTVRDGRPLNPMSPSRKGVVRDERLKALNDFVIDRLFECAATTRNPSLIRTAFQMDVQRAHKLPVFLARTWHLEPYNTGDTVIESLGHSKVFPYDSQPILIEPTITVVDFQGNTREAEYGIAFFTDVAEIDTLAEDALCCVEKADEGRLHLQHVVWRPGPEHADAPWPGEFFKRGHFAVVDNPDDLSEATWHPVEQDVFVVNTPASSDIEDCEGLIVGCESVQKFLEGDIVDLLCSPDEDYDQEMQEEHFRGSLRDTVRQMIGNAVAPDITVAQAANLIDEPVAAIHPVTTETNLYSEEYIAMFPEDQREAARARGRHVEIMSIEVVGVSGAIKIFTVLH